MKNPEKWFSFIGWVGTLGEGATGAMLVFAPLLTLKVMGMDQAPADPVYLQFVGVFVLFTGVFYAVPRLVADAASRLAAWRTVLIGTGFLRLGVAAFLFFAIARSLLEPAWFSVPVYDTLFALVQFFVLARASVPGK